LSNIYCLYILIMIYSIKVLAMKLKLNPNRVHDMHSALLRVLPEGSTFTIKGNNQIYKSNNQTLAIIRGEIAYIKDHIDISADYAYS